MNFFIVWIKDAIDFASDSRQGCKLKGPGNDVLKASTIFIKVPLISTLLLFSSQHCQNMGILQPRVQYSQGHWNI